MIFYNSLMNVDLDTFTIKFLVLFKKVMTTLSLLAKMKMNNISS